MIGPNTIVVIAPSDLRDIIREVLAEEFKKDRYYSPNNDSNKILNLQQAAEYCGICTRTLVSRVKQGKLKSGGTGRNYRFRIGDLDSFMFNEQSAK